MLRIANLRVPAETTTALAQLAAKRLKLPPQAVLEVVLIRKALDARRKNNISFVYTLDVRVAIPEGQVLARLRGDKDVSVTAAHVLPPLHSGSLALEHRPVIVGLGPAGMLAALTLARHGYRPLVLERGRDVDRRMLDIGHFWQSGCLDTSSNVQFGEGGAGTFSDGKLTTRVNHPGMREVLDILVEAGAPPEIKYLHKPHIGTDNLRQVVKNIRQSILALGGEIEFASQVTRLIIKDRQLQELEVNGSRRIPCTVALLGIGHSARDTYTMLHECGVAMEAKPFAIGVRIEHPQELIARAQYGGNAPDCLPAADYALVYQARAAGRSVYSFCMCPGGLVVAAASEPGRVVTNGMSNYARNSGIANSALVVNVNPADYGSSVLDGIAFQRKYEELAFQAGGRDYSAPVQTVGEFLAGTSGGSDFLVRPSYRPGVKPADLRDCLPEFVTAALAEALPVFGRKIKDFAHGKAVLSGVETRTSAPVRLKRTNGFESENTGGLYPIGEGAGYAGGIMSAAFDGLNAAQAVIGQYKSSK